MALGADDIAESPIVVVALADVVNGALACLCWPVAQAAEEGEGIDGTVREASVNFAEAVAGEDA